jgi:hypothetical protein
MARLARLFLVVALLGAFQGALVHPLKHFDEHGGFVHLGERHSDEGGTASGELCDLLASLTGCAAASFPQLTVVQASQQRTQHPVAAPRAAQPPPFLSQGPPALL